MKPVAILPALLAAMLVLAACGGDDDGGSTVAADGEVACSDVEAPAPEQLDLEAPTAKAPTASAIVFNTSCGAFTVTLDAESMPKTAASFQYLAEQGAYDDTTYHRVAPGFVIQGGDPLGDGTGGPGYSVTEKVPGDTVYATGLVAMAKSGAEPPGTSGSQFFVVTAPADAGLPPDYAVVGEVTDGFETIQAIEALADPTIPDGPPTQTVITEETTVEE